MKIWIVTQEVMSTFDEYTPQSIWRSIDKIFNTKDKALSYVRECIKNDINEQREEPDPDVQAIIDHIPTDEELLDRCGCWYKTIHCVEEDDYSYIIEEYNIE